MVGARVVRLEDPALLQGQGRFVDDISLPGTLAASFVRSPIAHGRVASIDTTKARALAGVHAVLTLDDLPEALREKPLPLLLPNPAITQPLTQYVLARKEVAFVGEAVAVVIADSRYIAEDAAQLVEVDFVPLAAASDCRDALADAAPRAHQESPDNLAARFTVAFGEPDPAFEAAAHVVGESLWQHRGGSHSIEGRAVLASHDKSQDLLTLWSATQAPHLIKRSLVELLDRHESRVRVIAPDVGGGFGPKALFYPEEAVIALATIMLGRPVKWIEDRREHFLATTQERDQYWDVELAIDANGRILGYRGTMIHDTGAYVPWGIISPYIAAVTTLGPYVVPSFHLDVSVALTNKVPTTPVRGAGRPQAVFAMERLMDRAARATGLDPAEIRRRNFIQPEQMPYDVGLLFRDGRPVTYDSGDYPAAQAKALELADYEGFTARQAAARGEGRYTGIGIGNYVEATGLGPFEGATVEIGPSGKIFVRSGAAPQGQGHRTTLAQICADQFGVGIGDVEVMLADTEIITNGIGTFASRITVNAGSSVHLAAMETREKASKIAAHMLEAAEEDLEFGDGRVWVKGVPDLSVGLGDLAKTAMGMPGIALPAGIEAGLESTHYFQPDQAAYCNGSHAVEVEVDIETGRVQILNYAIAHDAGTLINPLLVDGQVQGAVAHGIGNALFEWMRYDENAQPLTTNFAEYLLPAASDVPEIALEHIVSPSPLNPLGVKGAGEGGTIPAAAAIVAAIENALEPFGVHLTGSPVTPDRIAELIAAAGAGDGSAAATDKN